jgi:hypothetical protein
MGSIVFQQPVNGFVAALSTRVRQLPHEKSSPVNHDKNFRIPP